MLGESDVLALFCSAKFPALSRIWQHINANGVYVVFELTGTYAEGKTLYIPQLLVMNNPLNVIRNKSLVK